jgi:hypothetical protein
MYQGHVFIRGEMLSLALLDKNQLDDSITKRARYLFHPNGYYRLAVMLVTVEAAQ